MPENINTGRAAAVNVTTTGPLHFRAVVLDISLRLGNDICFNTGVYDINMYSGFTTSFELSQRKPNTRHQFVLSWELVLIHLYTAMQ